MDAPVHWMRGYWEKTPVHSSPGGVGDIRTAGPTPGGHWVLLQHVPHLPGSQHPQQLQTAHEQTKEIHVWLRTYFQSMNSVPQPRWAGEVGTLPPLTSTATGGRSPVTVLDLLLRTSWLVRICEVCSAAQCWHHPELLVFVFNVPLLFALVEIARRLIWSVILGDQTRFSRKKSLLEHYFHKSTITSNEMSSTHNLKLCCTVFQVSLSTAIRAL
jgi:hypothetical protein